MKRVDICWQFTINKSDMLTKQQKLKAKKFDLKKQICKLQIFTKCWSSFGQVAFDKKTCSHHISKTRLVSLLERVHHWKSLTFLWQTKSINQTSCQNNKRWIGKQFWNLIHKANLLLLTILVKWLSAKKTWNNHIRKCVQRNNRKKCGSEKAWHCADN